MKCSHRLDFEHDCEALKQSKASSSTGSSLTAPFKIFSGASTSINANKWKGNRKDAGKLLSGQFQNKTHQPIGQSSIEMPDRFHVDVYFPLKSNTPPVHMFFSKNWKVGKILDKVAEQGKVKNVNSTELDKTKRLNLFTLDGVILPTDKKLSEIDPKVLKNRDGIILEYGEELDPSLM